MFCPAISLPTKLEMFACFTHEDSYCFKFESMLTAILDGAGSMYGRQHTIEERTQWRADLDKFEDFVDLAIDNIVDGDVFI